MSDIVEDCKSNRHCPECQEAADAIEARDAEIERLRAENEELRADVDRLNVDLDAAAIKVDEILKSDLDQLRADAERHRALSKVVESFGGNMADVIASLEEAESLRVDAERWRTYRRIEQERVDAARKEEQ